MSSIEECVITNKSPIKFVFISKPPPQKKEVAFKFNSNFIMALGKICYYVIYCDWG